jgi:hypothetical protein
MTTLERLRTTLTALNLTAISSDGKILGGARVCGPDGYLQ